MAPFTTWKLVTMCPLSSYTKPDPSPRGTVVGSRLYPVRLSTLLVMNTTLGVASLKSRTLLVSSPSSTVGVPSGTARRDTKDGSATGGEGLTMRSPLSSRLMTSA